MKDKYLEWLKNRRKKIIEQTHEDFRDMFLKIHDTYAEQYIILKNKS